MRLIYLITFLLLYTTGLLAQKNNSRDINETVDYVTAVCINSILYPEKLIADKIEKITINDIPKEQTSTINLFKELQELKKESNISEYSDFFSEQIFSDKKKYNKIYEFAAKRGEVKMNTIKSSIVAFINENADLPNQDSIDLSEHNGASNDEQIISNDNQGSSSSYTIDQFESKVKEKPSFFDLKFWMILLAVIMAVMGAVLFLLIKYTFRIEDSLRKIKNEGKEVKMSDNVKDVPAQKYKELEIEIRAIRNQLKSLQEEGLSNNQSSNSSTKTIQKEGKREIQNAIQLEVPPRRPQEIFYMPMPDDVFFDDSSKSSFSKPTQSLYKFTVDEANSSKATFIFASDDIGISEAVNSPHRYLDPICEAQNARNQNAKKITTIVPGVAEKRGDKWEVLTKAKIKYE